MKEHFQDFGVRKWAGDDLIELQAEPLAALQGLVAPYAPCILQGCEMEAVPDGSGGTTYRLHAGLAALKGVDAAGNACVKIVRVAEETKLAETVYLYLACESKSRTYADGKNKVITYEYKGKFSNQPVEGALKISKDDGGPRLVDTLGITRKLNRVGGEAKDVVVTFTEDVGKDAPEDLQSGLTLGLLISGIKKWLGKKVDKRDGYVLSKNDFSDEWMKKLDGIPGDANNYVHPTYPSTSSGLYKITVDGSGHVSSATAVTKSDITTLGIPGQDTTYSVATTSSNGLMSSTDKSKLDGIKTGGSKTKVLAESGEYVDWPTKGIDGAQGPQGIQGIPGPQGDKGDRGEQGPQGERGSLIFTTSTKSTSINMIYGYEYTKSTLKPSSQSPIVNKDYLLDTLSKTMGLITNVNANSVYVKSADTLQF